MVVVPLAPAQRLPPLAFGPVGTAFGAGIGAVIGSEVGKRAMKALLSW